MSIFHIFKKWRSFSRWLPEARKIINFQYLEVKYLGKEYLVFVNSKVSVIFGSHLENGGHIEKLRDGSIAYFIQ